MARHMSPEALHITPATDEADRDACARIMAASDPWITLGIGFEQARAAIAAPGREIYVARGGEIDVAPDRDDAEHAPAAGQEGVVAGFVVVCMEGVLSGYVQTLAVADAFRGQGVGAMLLTWAEARIFSDRPNVFLFVSSFNPRAQKFYEAHGYEQVGSVPDFLVRGHSEHLMRKTIGPLLG